MWTLLLDSLRMACLPLAGMPAHIRWYVLFTFVGVHFSVRLGHLHSTSCLQSQDNVHVSGLVVKQPISFPCPCITSLRQLYTGCGRLTAGRPLIQSPCSSCAAQTSRCTQQTVGRWIHRVAHANPGVTQLLVLVASASHVPSQPTSGSTKITPADCLM